eukprot:1650655-Prymnesium_polylepis.1
MRARATAPTHAAPVCRASHTPRTPPPCARQSHRGRGRQGGGRGAQGQQDAPNALPRRCAAPPLAWALPHARYTCTRAMHAHSISLHAPLRVCPCAVCAIAP